MRLAAGVVANAVAWAVFGLLIVGAVMVTDRLGFVGLLLLGGVTALVCLSATLDQKVPTWGVDVFRAGMEQPRREDEKAAAHAEHQAAVGPLRFYGACGALLAGVGLVGVAWEIWGR